MLKCLRSIDTSTFSGVEYEAEEAVEAMEAPSEAVGDVD
jgi:hypothetical protein